MIKEMLLSLGKYIDSLVPAPEPENRQNADCNCCILRICCCNPCNCLKNALPGKPRVTRHHAAKQEIADRNCRKFAVQTNPCVTKHQGAIASAKRCPRCGQGNRLYYRNASARDGLQSWCKQCQLDYQKGKSAGTAGITPVIPPEVIYPEMDIAALYQQMVSASYSTDVTPLPEPQPDPPPEPDFKPHIEIPDLTGAGELAANVTAEVAGYFTGIPGLGLGITMLKMIGDAGNDR